MTKDLPLTDKIDKIEEMLSEITSGKSKKKKFKLPLGIRMNKGKFKKDHVLVLLIKANKQTTFKVCKIEDDTIMIDRAIYDARSGNILRYKNFPMLILAEWNTQPLTPDGETQKYREFNPEDDYSVAERDGNLTSPMRLILTKMEMEAVKPSMAFNMKTLIAIAIFIGVAYFVLDYFKILA